MDTRIVLTAAAAAAAVDVTRVTNPLAAAFIVALTATVTNWQSLKEHLQFGLTSITQSPPSAHVVVAFWSRTMLLCFCSTSVSLLLLLLLLL